MKNIKQFFNKFLSNIKSSFSYYPVTISLCIIFAILFVFRTEYMDFAGKALEETIETLFLGLGVAIFGSMNIHLLINGYKKINKFKIPVWITFFALATIYYLFGIKELTMIPIVRSTVIMLVLFCTYIVIPWFSKEIKVEQFSVKFMIESVIAAFYAFVLFGGLMLIDFAFETLMDINPEHEFVVFALAFSFLIVFPMLVFSRIQDEYKQSKILKILIINIVMPLLAAYTVVLYMYFIRMLILMTIPSNMITNLVFWYILIGIFTLFIAYLYDDDSKWLHLFTKFFPIATLIPIGLMFMALIIRINAYGVTEPRFTLLIIGMWGLAVMLYFIFAKRTKRTIAVLPVSLALISIMLVASPFNMFVTSINSQNKRFSSLYENVTTLSEEEGSGLLNIAYYFNDNHSLEEISDYPKNMTINEFALEYDLKTVYQYDNFKAGTIFKVESYDQIVMTKGYDYIFQNIWKEITYEQDINVIIKTVDDYFTVTIDGELVVNVNMLIEIDRIYDQYKNREEQDGAIILLPGESELSFDTDKWKVKVIIGEFYYRGADTVFNQGSTIVLIGEN